MCNHQGWVGFRKNHNDIHCMSSININRNRVKIKLLQDLLQNYFIYQSYTVDSLFLNLLSSHFIQNTRITNIVNSLFDLNDA